MSVDRGLKSSLCRHGASLLRVDVGRQGGFGGDGAHFLCHDLRRFLEAGQVSGQRAALVCHIQGSAVKDNADVQFVHGVRVGVSGRVREPQPDDIQAVLT